MCNTLEEAIKNAGLETEIRNIIFHLVRSKLKPEEKPSQINIVSVEEEINYPQENCQEEIYRRPIGDLSSKAGHQGLFYLQKTEGILYI